MSDMQELIKSINELKDVIEGYKKLCLEKDDQIKRLIGIIENN